jgi:hypothetical protein
MYIDRSQDFIVVHFGLISDSSALLDSYCAVITPRAMTVSQQSLLEFVSRMPPRSNAGMQPSWKPSTLNERHDVVDYIHASHQDRQAEICFGNVAQGPTIDAMRRKEITDVLSVSPLIMIRVPLDLQREFIEQLYVE